MENEGSFDSSRNSITMLTSNMVKEENNRKGYSNKNLKYGRAGCRLAAAW